MSRLASVAPAFAFLVISVLGGSTPALAVISYKVKPECAPVEAALKTMYKEDRAKYQSDLKKKYAAEVGFREFSKDVHASLKRIHARLDTKAYRDMMAACEAGVEGAKERVWKMQWAARDAEAPFEKRTYKASPYSLGGLRIRSDGFFVELRDRGHACSGRYVVSREYAPRRDNSECLKYLRIGLAEETRRCQTTPADSRPACYEELKQKLAASQEICSNWSYDSDNATWAEGKMDAWPLEAPNLDDIAEAPVKPDLEYYSESYYVVKNIDEKCLVLDGGLPAASVSEVSVKPQETAYPAPGLGVQPKGSKAF